MDALLPSERIHRASEAPLLPALQVSPMLLDHQLRKVKILGHQSVSYNQFELTGVKAEDAEYDGVRGNDSGLHSCGWRLQILNLAAQDDASRSGSEFGRARDKESAEEAAWG